MHNSRFISRLNPFNFLNYFRSSIVFCRSFNKFHIGDNETEKWVSPPSSKNDTCKTSFTNNHLRSLFWHDQPSQQIRTHDLDIEVVDSDTWRVSSGLAPHVLSKSVDCNESKLRSSLGVEADDGDDGVVHDYPDIDEIEDMRIHGKLFYKIDPSSKEFEEYSFDFHGRKSKKNHPKFDRSTQKGPKNSMKMNNNDNNRKFDGNDGDVFVNEERLKRTIKEEYIVCNPEEGIDGSCVGKKKRRSPTFDQLTGPYHEPFCLDIYVSKGSVRACVVHRATSKVVAVAHSISKDMKFDVGSTKSVVAAKAVGKVLAQRALADDIHNVIFMPRKGDKLEGKLQIVLQSIIDNGVNVKVKLKQRNPNKAVQKSSGL